MYKMKPMTSNIQLSKTTGTPLRLVRKISITKRITTKGTVTCAMAFPVAGSRVMTRRVKITPNKIKPIRGSTRRYVMTMLNVENIIMTMKILIHASILFTSLHP
jgi:hypothetical protein